MSDAVRAILLTAMAMGLLLLGWEIYRQVSRTLADRHAAHAAKQFTTSGTLLVPPPPSRDLRGAKGQDYWCFSTGPCFYPIHRFRSLYPAYNDLEDDILLVELRP